MNRDYIKSILLNEISADGLIQPNELIDLELCEFIREHRKYSKDIFAPIDKNKKNVYFVECSCEKCGEIFIHESNKTNLLLFFQSGDKSKSWQTKNFRICDDCKQIEKIEQEKTTNNTHKVIVDRTKVYIDAFLSIDNEWNKGVSQRERINLIRDMFVDRDIVAEHIKSMPYKDFLQTLYWKQIASYKKYICKNRCQLCGGVGVLNVHHSTYEHHGRELEYINKDLICLCSDCHNNFHKKQKELKNERNQKSC